MEGACATSLGEVYLSQVRRRDDAGLGDLLDLFKREARGVLLEDEVVAGGFEESEVGHDQLDDTRRRNRQVALVEQAGPAVTGLVLHHDEDALGTRRDVHGAADATARAGAGPPVRE